MSPLCWSFDWRAPCWPISVTTFSPVFPCAAEGPRSRKRSERERKKKRWLNLIYIHLSLRLACVMYVCGVHTCAQVGLVCCEAEGSPLLQRKKHWGGAGRCVEQPGSGWAWRWQNWGWMWPLPAAARPVGTGWLESAAYLERGLKTGRAGLQSGTTVLCLCL